MAGEKSAKAFRNFMIALGLVLLPLFPFSPLILVVSVLFFLLGICVKGSEAIRESGGAYDHLALLQCLYCGHMNPPNSLRCLNCGAPIHRELAATEIVRIRRQSAARTSRVKCLSCGAVYSYGKDSISRAGEVPCQNCAKPIRVPAEKMPREPIGPKVSHREPRKVRRTTKRLRCLHCNAVYLYQSDDMSETGLVRCQNCGEHFRDPDPEYL